MNVVGLVFQVAAVLQNYRASQQTFPDDQRAALGLQQYLQIAKRRLFYFLIPFVVIVSAGIVVAAVQQPVYLAEGKVLVESQEIPTDLVRPTVTDGANQRIQVIQQLVMTRDKLLAIVNKFDLFPAQRRWMTGSQVLDLMKERTQLKQVELNLPTASRRTIAFTLSFEYENPELAMRVANEFLTLILAEDARTRTNQASETTKFLEGEVKRLEGELRANEAKVAEFRRRQQQDLPPDVPDPAKLLAALQADLVQKTSIYSEAHPMVQTLRARIAALQKAAASAPGRNASGAPADVDVDGLERAIAGANKSLEETNAKLSVARLGERMERDQQSERLRVIEQPTVPQKPVKPNRMKLLAMSFMMAGALGASAVFAVETLDKSIRGTHELIGVVDSHFIVTIPYIATEAETARRRLIIIIVGSSLALVFLGGLGAALYLAPTIDFSTLGTRFWTDVLTRLSK